MKLLDVLRLVSIVVALSSLVLTGCGGGGGGGGGGSTGNGNQAVVPQSSASSNALSSVASSVNFNASTSLLSVAAKESDELYVDPQFTFDSTKTIELKIYARDSEGFPLSGKRVDVYLVPDSVESLQDEEAQVLSLLTSGFTGVAGELYRSVEVPVTVKRIKLQLDAMGIETQTLITLDQNVIEHRF